MKQDLPNTRYVFVDALRGIAALAVVSHHLLHNTILEVTLRKIIPGIFLWLFVHGAQGVEVFFVISGFVIAHSLWKTRFNSATLGNFILRRQLRLDPPYWVALLIMVILNCIENRVPGLVTKPVPDGGAFLLNMCYLQNITGITQVLDVAWTLCLEIQFYVVFIVFLMLGQIAQRDRPGELSSGSFWLVFITGAISLLLSSGQRLFAPWAHPYWCYFAGGALCNWAITGRLPTGVFVVFAGLFGVRTVWQNTPEMYVGLGTMLLFFIVGKRGHLTDWFEHPVLQYFGRISYSLYLVHLPIIYVVMRGGYKLTHTNVWAALCWFFLAAACSILAGQVLHILVERPSMRFASRFKQARPEPAVSLATT